MHLSAGTRKMEPHETWDTTGMTEVTAQDRHGQAPADKLGCGTVCCQPWQDPSVGVDGTLPTATGTAAEARRISWRCPSSFMDELPWQSFHNTSLDPTEVKM